MSTQETTETAQAPAPSTNKRFFDVVEAATVLTDLAVEGAIERELEAAGIVAEADYALHFLRSQGISSQAHFAAVVINLTHGEGATIEPDALTRAVAVAFPNASVGKRHGPHYLCHARKGNLTGLRENLPTIPYAKKTKKTKKTAPAEPEVPVAEGDQPAITAELLLKDNDRKVLVEMAKGMEGVKASGKTADIAQRIADFMNAPAPKADEAEAA
jgi:hypothetical protein